MNRIKRLGCRFGRTAVACAALAGGALSTSVASAQVTLPDVGVDPAEYVNAAVSDFGGVVAACVGAFFAVLIVTMAFKWGRKAIAG